MSTVTQYSFEKKGGEEASWTTFDSVEANEFAKANGYSVIANEFEYSDRTVVSAWDYAGLLEEDEPDEDDDAGGD